MDDYYRVTINSCKYTFNVEEDGFGTYVEELEFVSCSTCGAVGDWTVHPGSRSVRVECDCGREYNAYSTLNETTRKVTLSCGCQRGVGEEAFNFYDRKLGTILRIDVNPEPDTMRGQSVATDRSEWSNYWFDHSAGASLDGSRACCVPAAIRYGHMEAPVPPFEERVRQSAALANGWTIEEVKP